MGGLSLECGDCNTQFRTVEEAQEHAELTGHAKFRESTEPVLNLVCNECGKPCRTKTESDLHTKRTGHAGFSDKTAETAKPIVLETSGQAPSPTSGPAPVDETTQDMVVPEVNKELLRTLEEEMGFSTARATRAIHFSGGADLDAAVNWIVEHEDDADIDEMPLVPASVLHAPAPSLSPEEAKIKAQELRERARKKKEEEEKKTERGKEKERIRVGREMLEAKRTEEDNERKRIALFRKQEKEEEKRAREKIRQKLEEDKAERRRKLGLPPEDPKPEAAAAPPPEAEAKKSPVIVRPATKADQMRNCLRSLKQSHKGDDAKAKTAFQTLLTLVGNVARSPDEEKYRKIRLSNPTFQERVGSHGVEFLQICGFEKEKEGEFLLLARENVASVLLNSAGMELNSAITNPFFGVL
eukprot:TRINITY_DN13188_c0_g1_i1.p1 TRINITY_DN13188_c0_g1~~TRINITY_DN13188_c0_g1_i1.p1  ORF type:complete len:412 (-),score=103.16 TRINITY_DN13188_c0_g1_i1:264-1499(-)